MKTTDSVMREFDEKFVGKDGVWRYIPKPDNVKDFLSHSLSEARREEQERILTMAHNIRSELKEPGYISLTRLEDLLTGEK